MKRDIAIRVDVEDIMSDEMFVSKIVKAIESAFFLTNNIVVLDLVEVNNIDLIEVNDEHARISSVNLEKGG